MSDRLALMSTGSLAVSFSLFVAATGCSGTVGLNAHAVVPVPPPVRVRTNVSVRIAFFGIPLEGANDVVFVLDRSGSMSGVAAGGAVKGGTAKKILVGLGAGVANDLAGRPMPTKLEAAKEELIQTLEAMPDGTRFNVIFFNDQLAALSPTMIVLEAGSRASTYAFIRGIQPSGSTAAVPAMRLAYDVGAARVVLLSDGLANHGGSGGDLLAEARPRIGQGLRIDTVGIGLDQDAGLLQTLASESGGMAVMR